MADEFKVGLLHPRAGGGPPGEGRYNPGKCEHGQIGKTSRIGEPNVSRQRSWAVSKWTRRLVRPRPRRLRNSHHRQGKQRFSKKTLIPGKKRNGKRHTRFRNDYFNKCLKPVECQEDTVLVKRLKCETLTEEVVAAISEALKCIQKASSPSPDDDIFPGKSDGNGELLPPSCGGPRQVDHRCR